MGQGYAGLKKAQYAYEDSAKGTKPTIDKILVGKLGFNPEITWHEPDEELGIMSRFSRRTKVGERTSLAFEGVPNFEQIIHFLAMTIQGGVTPTDAGDGRYVWHFWNDVDAVPSFDTISLEVGDNVQAWDIPYVFCTGLEFTIAMNAPLTLRADMVGRPMAKGSFTGSIYPSAVEDIIATKAFIAIDDTFAGIGGTQKNMLLLGGTIRVPGCVPRDYVDGNLYFGGWGGIKRNLELNLTLEIGADAITEYDALQAGTMRFIKITIQGSALGSDTRFWQVNTAGRWTSWDKIGESEGMDIVAARFVSEYDLTSKDEYELVVCTDQSAL